MKGYTSISFLLFLVILAATGYLSTAAAGTAAVEFLRRSCRATQYPRLCEQSLMAYAPSVRHSPRKLARAAVTVSSDRARDASTFLGQIRARPGPARSRHGGAVKDCVDTLKDSVDRLRQSAGEMVRMGRARSPRFAWHLDNVQTWVSGALTDLNTCLDSVATYEASPELRAAIRNKVVDVVQVTSNALALVNQLGPHV